MRLDGDAVRFQDLLAVAHRVERRGPRADRADAQLAQPVDHAADGGEPREVLRELRRVGRSVCSVVSEYGMPYCCRLLHDDILPQKLSRRSAIVILPRASGVAWTSTGTSGRPGAACRPSPRSSPKFGSVTMTPSILSRAARNRSAHCFASSRVSTAPCLVCLRRRGRPRRSPRLRAPRSSPRGRFGQVVGEESAVADDEAERHSVCHDCPYLTFLLRMGEKRIA